MYDYDDEEESESNPVAMAPSPLHSSYQLRQQTIMQQNNHQQSSINLMRSKSYDLKLNNIENDDEHMFASNMGGENVAIKNTNLAMSVVDKNLSQNEHTKIIVTSFAPEPKSKSNILRPAFQYAKDEDSNGKQQKNENYENNFNRNLSLLWPNGKNSPPIILFCGKVVRKTVWECKKIGEQYRLTYKFQHGEKKLVKTILDGHGFRETHPNSSEFNIIWTGSNLKSYTYRSLQENQKVNHFPRSSELTRKDRLYKNIQRMQKEKGLKAFSIVPTTFIMPFEIDEFYTTFYKEKGVWIVKPVSLSRGRGIFLINHPDQIPLDDNLVVSKYIPNPLLVEGFKFDIRLYVAVTSFDPLVFYLYEEGLTRFATIKYDQNVRNIKSTCMHLTNYSLNKKNEKYVRCDDPDVEDYGNKWSMSALLRFLKSQGKDTFNLMMQIEETIIKTLLSVESPLASAARMFIPFKGNCFELFGFDILVDDQFKPWVLEVNLSPSLDCEALLDARIKSTMVSDLFTLTGIVCQNPSIYSNKSRHREQFKNSNKNLRLRPHSAAGAMINANSSSNNINSKKGGTMNKIINDPLYDGLSPNEVAVLKTVIDENQRSNGWVRLFPTSDTMEFYSQFLETRSTSFNSMLHKKLFPRRWQSGNPPKKTSQSRAKVLENLNLLYKENSYNSSELTGASLYEALDRYKKYERKLKDTIRPNEDTLKRLSSQPHMSQPPPHSKSNFNIFPNGDLKQRLKDSIDSKLDTNLNDDLNEEDSVYTDRNRNSVISYPSVSAIQNKKQLPSITANVNRPSLATIGRSKTSPDDFNSSKKNQSKGNENEYNQSKFKSDQHSDIDRNNDEKDLNNNTSEIVYNIETVLKYLEEDYYLSRIQVRTAFSLYLFKIQVRLVAESQIKDDSNLQQMDLVIRFIKKAAPNLSQEFKVFVPSKRLPLSEQKRMLAKQLHDFLHVYRKDTEQIRIDMSSQFEAERKKYSNKIIDEKAFQTLLYKCSESELEEIMSIYMKNSQDSSVFLGSSRAIGPVTNNIQINSSNSRSSSAVASSSSINKIDGKDDSKNKNVQKNNSHSSITSKQNNNFENDSILLSQMKEIKKNKKISSSPQANQEFSKKNENESESVIKEKNADEFSNVSCDSHSRSIFTNSSGEESDGFSKSSHSRSRSNSSNSSPKNKRKIRPLSKRHEKLNPYLLSLPSRRHNKIRAPLVHHKKVTEIIKRGHSSSNKKIRSEINNLKEKNTSSYTSISGKNEEYEKIMTEIYAKRNNENNETNHGTKDLKNRVNKLNSTSRPATSLSTVTLTRSNSSTDRKNQVQIDSNLTVDNNHNSNESSNNANLNQLNGKLDHTSAKLAELSKKYEISNYMIQRHTNGNDYNMKPALNQSNYEEEQAILNNGLRNLALRQQERIYSAGSSLNNDDNLHKLSPNQQKNSSDSNKNNSQISNNSKEAEPLKLNSGTSLIDKLEIQREKTSQLLKLSKAKHNELISSMMQQYH